MSLQSLFSEQGQTYVSIAGLIASAFPNGLDPTLLERADTGRQPLPIEVAQPIAEQLGLQLGDVLAEVPSATRLKGVAVRRPLPAIPELGEKVKQLGYVPTKQLGE